VDFSPATPHAVVPAASLATEYGGDLHLVHVLNFPYPHLESVAPSFDLQRYYLEMEEEAEKRLSGLVDEDSRKYANTFEHVLRGVPYEEIVRFAEDRDVDMIVMPTHGRTGIDRLLYGSVAEKVVRMADCPVLTVSPFDGAPKAFSPDRIVFTTDFSDASDSAFGYALSLADKYEASLLMVHVVTLWDNDPANPDWRFPAIPPEHVDAVMSAAREQLDDREHRMGDDGVEIEARLVRGFDPAHEIVRIVEAEDADLVVMSTHGRTGLAHALLGSTAEKVVRYLDQPVLTIRYREPDDD
jgi:nucleotide-binding universal stress UspA family protein